MSKQAHKSNRSFSISILRWPVLWGAAATIGFYVAIRDGHINHPLVIRYFANHPVEYIATTMFFVGLAALFIKLLELLYQPSVSGKDILGPIPDQGQPASDCPELLAAIESQPATIRNSMIAVRLRDSVEYVRRTRSADGIEDQMRTLAENAENRSSNSYSLVRIIISTIPILGFLGTVIGITRAVAELAQLVGDISFEEAINSVVSGLSVAFDTTALALALSIVLMFFMFFVSRWETRMLADIEIDSSETMVGRFLAGQDHQPQILAIQKIGEEVVRSTQQLVVRQAELWHHSMEAAERKWVHSAAQAEKQLGTSLTVALHQSLEKHTSRLQAAEVAAENRASHQQDRVVQAMGQLSVAAGKQQQELGSQTELLMKTIDATHRVLKIEDALNNNLKSLREAQHFDQAISSLTAAASLLSSKLGQFSSTPPQVRLPKSNKPGNAA